MLHVSVWLSEKSPAISQQRRKENEHNNTMSLKFIGSKAPVTTATILYISESSVMVWELKRSSPPLEFWGRATPWAWSIELDRAHKTNVAHWAWRLSSEQNSRCSPFSLFAFTILQDYQNAQNTGSRICKNNHLAPIMWFITPGIDCVCCFCIYIYKAIAKWHSIVKKLAVFIVAKRRRR